MIEIAFILLLLPGLAFLVGVVVLLATHHREIATVHRDGICDQCGYDLTGNVSGVCPECGLGKSLSDGEDHTT